MKYAPTLGTDRVARYNPWWLFWFRPDWSGPLTKPAPFVAWYRFELAKYEKVHREARWRRE